MPLPMASGIVFQKDRITPAHQEILRTSENAVKTQIWIVISIYVLAAIFKKRLQLELSLYAIFQVLSITVCKKQPID